MVSGPAPEVVVEVEASRIPALRIDVELVPIKFPGIDFWGLDTGRVDIGALDVGGKLVVIGQVIGVLGGIQGVVDFILDAVRQIRKGDGPGEVQPVGVDETRLDATAVDGGGAVCQPGKGDQSIHLDGLAGYRHTAHRQRDGG